MGATIHAESAWGGTGAAAWPRGDARNTRGDRDGLAGGRGKAGDIAGHQDLETGQQPVEQQP